MPPWRYSNPAGRTSNITKGIDQCRSSPFLLFKYSIFAKYQVKVVGLMNNRKRTLKEIEELANRIVPILRDGGVVEASVFGSIARGEAYLHSDIDLLVRYKETVSLFDVSGLKCELESLLGTKVDLISKDYLKPRIKKQILKESIRIL